MQAGLVNNHIIDRYKYQKRLKFTFQLSIYLLIHRCYYTDKCLSSSVGTFSQTSQCKLVFHCVEYVCEIGYKERTAVKKL